MSSSERITKYFKPQKNGGGGGGGGTRTGKRKELSEGEGNDNNRGGSGVIPQQRQKVRKVEVEHKKEKTPPPPTPSPFSPVKFVMKGRLSPMKNKDKDKGQGKEEIKALLRKSGKLDELKKVLEGLKRKEEEYRKNRDKEKASPSPSPIKGVGKHDFYSKEEERDVFSSPVKLKDIKSREKQEPGHRRFRHLLDPTPELHLKKATLSSPKKEPPLTSPSLPLPHHYSTLLSLFGASETVLKLTTSNQQGEGEMDFIKLKKSVQQIVRTVNLKEVHIGQFLTVIPDCYRIERDKESNELSIKFPLDYKPSNLEGRRKLFREKLVEICIKEHETFLSRKLDLPSIPPNTVITRFHPSFNLESIPNIVPSPLPPLISKTPATAKEFLAKAQSLVQCNQRVRQAINNLVKEEEEREEKTKGATPISSPTPTKSTKKQLRGISESLLARIRAKEAAKTLQALTLPPNEIRKEELLKSLPKYARTIRNIFMIENKVSLPFDIVVERLGAAIHGNRTQGDTVRDTVLLLSEKHPSFCTFLRLDGGEEWIKLDLKFNVNSITN